MQLYPICMLKFKFRFMPMVKTQLIMYCYLYCSFQEEAIGRWALIGLFEL